jgi:hypothetical protein
MTWGGKREGSGAKPKPRLTPEEVQALIQEQGGLCALCSEPGMLHPKCKELLALGRDNPRRFQMAITYLEQRTAAPPRLLVRPAPAAVPKSLE